MNMKFNKLKLLILSVLETWKLISIVIILFALFFGILGFLININIFNDEGYNRILHLVLAILFISLFITCIIFFFDEVIEVRFKSINEDN